MRHPWSVYIQPGNIARIDEIFQNISLPQVQRFVVTDGERILRPGDLDSDGTGISAGREIGIAQRNTPSSFPGMGLGALVAKANKVTDQMFTAASEALSGLATPERAERTSLLAELRNIRRISFEVALAVASQARDAGLGRLLAGAELARAIQKARWDPRSSPYGPGRLPV